MCTNLRTNCGSKWARTVQVQPTYIGGGRGNLFPYVPVVTYVSTNGCSVVSDKVSTGIARVLELLPKIREGA